MPITKGAKTTEGSHARQFDLEDRTMLFAKETIAFSRALRRTLPNIEILKQLIRAAGSVGANYIEANEALSTKDFIMRAKICRKEAKESRYWLNLVEVSDDDTEKLRKSLIQEATELTLIFNAIITKAQLSEPKP